MDCHKPKNEVGSPFFTPHTKIHSKCIIDLNVKGKIIKLLEENTGVNLQDFWLGNSFLDNRTKNMSDKRENK